MEKEIILLLRKILIALLVVWMIVVFCLSNQNGEQSGALSKKVALLVSFGNEKTAETIEPTVRKVAHITEYAIGAMIFFGILVTYQKYVLGMRVAMTLGFILVFAGLDEIHQAFIVERSASLIDVGIDAFGAALGLLGACLLEGMIKIIDDKVKEEVERTEGDN